MQRGSVEHSCRSYTLWCFNQKHFAGENTRVGITKLLQHSAKKYRKGCSLFVVVYVTKTKNTETSLISLSIHLIFSCHVSDVFVINHLWRQKYSCCTGRTEGNLKGILLWRTSHWLPGLQMEVGGSVGVTKKG